MNISSGLAIVVTVLTVLGSTSSETASGTSLDPQLWGRGALTGFWRAK